MLIQGAIDSGGIWTEQANDILTVRWRWVLNGFDIKIMIHLHDQYCTLLSIVIRVISVIRRKFKNQPGFDHEYDESS